MQKKGQSLGGVLFISLLFLYTIPSFGQNAQNGFWFFGNSSRGLDFPAGGGAPNPTNNQATPFGRGGSAVATDPVTGILLFYTDGINVYDANNQLMPNGGNIGGDTTLNQGVTIVPVPGNSSQYYIFAINSAGNLTVTTVDMSLTGNGNTIPAGVPLGDVVPGEKNQPVAGMTGLGEAVTVVSGASDEQYWVISHVAGTSTYIVMEIGPGILPGDSITTYDLGGGAPAITAGSFSINPSGDQFAVTATSTGRNVQIIDFDNSTGAIGFNQLLLNTGASDEIVYDTEWSPDGSKLYVSRYNPTTNSGNVYQVDLNNPGALPASLLPANVAGSFGLQRGPDGRIYHLYSATPGQIPELGVFNNTDSAAADVTYNGQAFPNNDVNAFQFSSFLPSYNQPYNPPLGFNILGNCTNQGVLFTPQVEPPSDSIRWSFGDTTFSNEIAPIHIYENPGSFEVIMVSFLNGQPDTVRQFVTIDEAPQINIGADTVICPGESLTLDAGMGISFFWSTGETTQTITVDSAGYYWVVVDDGSTCTGYDGIQVDIYGEENQITNVWYFGNGAGIDFNEEPPVSLTDGPLINAPEGVATISDRNGDLLFYTDGENVYAIDRTTGNHVQLPGGTDIGGDSDATQSSVIVPVPGDETLFYIFTTEAVYGNGSYEFSYSLVDIKQNNGTGEVIASGVVLFPSSTERISSVTGGPGTWVLIHEFGTNTFRAYPVSEEGIGDPVLSSVGSVHNQSVAANAQGYMKFSPDGSKVAVAIPGMPNQVEIFSFNDSTGVLSDPVTVTLPDNMPASVYGLEFSGSGDFLYVSVNGNGATDSKLYQFETDTLQADSIQNSIVELSASSLEYGALQTGPDGQIYLAINGQSFLGVIANPEASGIGAGFTENGFILDAGTSGLGLPNFIQSLLNPPQEPFLAPQNVCIGEDVSFTSAGTSIIDEFFWDFGDGSTSTEQNPTHTYAAPGTYAVNLIITNRCGLDTLLSGQVEVFDLPDDPVIPANLFICTPPETVTVTNFNPNFSYQWISTNGDTLNTANINISDPGSYTLTVTDITNAGFCTSSATTVANDGRPTIDVGPDTVVCQNDPVTALNASNPGATFSWTINGAPAGNGQTQAVNTAIPGQFTYVVSVTDPLTSCIGTDTAIVAVNGRPVFTATAFDSPGCGNNQGEIQLNIPNGNFFYSLDGATVIPATSVSGPQPSLSITTTANTGNHIVTLADEISGCATDLPLSVSDAGAGFAVDNVNVIGNCDVFSLAVQLSAATSFDWELRVASTNALAASGSQSAVSTFSINTVAPGSYTLDIFENGTNCTVSFNPIDAVENPGTDLQVPVNTTLCAPDNRITVSSATPNATFVFSAGTGVIANVGPDFVELNEPGGDVTITASAPGFCDSTVTLPVVIDPEPQGAITIQGDPCDGQRIATVEITPIDNYSVEWLQSGNSFGFGNSIVVTNTENYSAQYRSNTTGCEGTAGPIEIEILEPVEVFLTSDFACDDGSGTTITASASPATGTITYSYVSPGGDTLATNAGNTLQVFEQGAYQVTAWRNGCTDTKSISITFAPVTPSLLPESVIFCPEEEEAILDPVNTFAAYNWFDPSGTLVSFNPVYETSTAGRYTAIFENSFGCETPDTVDVVENCIPQIVAPNAFRPSSSVGNNEFSVFTRYITDFEIYIYNRWGEQVFYSRDPDFRWDGNFQGQEASSGTYAFLIRFIAEYEPELGMQEKRGGVTLLR